MERVPTQWWRYIPERPWPTWLNLLGLVVIFVGVYLDVVLGGLIGFLAGLAVWLLAVPVFLAWQWIRWRARWGPRTRAKKE
jgi:hypothetical protein